MSRPWIAVVEEVGIQFLMSTAFLNEFGETSGPIEEMRLLGNEAVDPQLAFALQARHGFITQTKKVGFAAEVKEFLNEDRDMGRSSLGGWEDIKRGVDGLSK
jgi:hypothetical protein